MEAFTLLSVEPAFHQDISFKNQVKTSFFFFSRLCFSEKNESLKLTEQRNIKIPNESYLTM